MRSGDSNPLKRLTKPASTPLSSPLEEAWEAAADARDIIRDRQRSERRDLPSYTGDEEEVTANVNAPQQNHFHVTVNNGSKPDIELDGEIAVGPVKVRGLPTWLVAVAVPVAAGVTALVAWLLRR